MIYAIAGFIFAFFVVVALMSIAKEGWEDEAGFHRGEWKDGDK